MPRGQAQGAAGSSSGAECRPSPDAPDAWATAGEDRAHRDGEVSPAVWKPRRTPRLFLRAALISTWWIKHISS